MNIYHNSRFRKQWAILQLLMPIIVMPIFTFGSDDLLPIYNQTIQKADSLASHEKYTEASDILIDLFQSLKITNPHTRAELQNKIGRYLSMTGKDQEAKSFFFRALVNVKFNNDSVLMSDILNNIGISLEYTGHYDSAFFYYEKALKIREKQNDTNRLSASFRNIAQILRVMGRFKEATHYCRKASDLIPAIHDYKVIANIYNELAYLYELNNQLDSAKYYYLKLIYVAEENNFARGISVGYSNLASVYEQEEKYPDALRLKKKGLHIDKGIDDIYGIMTSYKSIAECYLLMKNYTVALIYLDSATTICDTAWLSDLHGIEILKFKAYKGKNNFRSALHHYEKAVILKDSLFNERRRKNIAEILTRYETEKKEQQIEILDKTNQIKNAQIKTQWILILGILLLSASGALISFLILRNKNHRIKQMSLELRNYILQHDDFKSDVNQQKEKSRIETFKMLTQKFGLTQRESEIMNLISQGLSNDELGEKLFISKNTIKYHIKNIYIKLDVKNRVQALQKTSMNYHSTGS